MKRLTCDRRPRWEATVESQGLIFHTTYETVADQASVVGSGGGPYREAAASTHQEKRKSAYWDESVYYQFAMVQIETLEAATNQLHCMCLEAVQRVISRKLYSQMRIPDVAIPMIEYSWENDAPAIYGRFDLAYDGVSAPKLLEYNADTPTSLIEAAVIQWYWKQDCHRSADQFNSIHERLVAKWKELRGYLKPGPLYFAHMDSWEDAMTSAYMADTASQAGLKVESVLVGDIGWSKSAGRFTDAQNRPMANCFKLYPWENMMADSFGQHLVQSMDQTCWVEPAWKMVLSNKAILPLLWEMFPNHENLLPASMKDSMGLDRYVSKPLIGREGQNVTVYDLDSKGNPTTSQHFGDYGKEGMVYQALAPIPRFDDLYYPVIGSWVIDGQSAGMGIRESIGIITDNQSRFVPHIIEG